MRKHPVRGCTAGDNQPPGGDHGRVVLGVSERFADTSGNGRGRSVTRLTGERPLEGLTPDSLLSLHAAGYREVRTRISGGRLIDLGCGEGLETVAFADKCEFVLGVDYAYSPLLTARDSLSSHKVLFAQMDAVSLALASHSFDWACSSHLIEHFRAPELHVSEIARVLRSNGSAFFLTPNRPADFENPFHVTLFDRDDLLALLERYFREVWVGGLDGSEQVKADFARRRARARKILALDPLKLRTKLPRSWYVGAYTKMLPLAYRLVAQKDRGGATGITEDDFKVVDQVDDTTLVLFAIATGPKAGR